MKPLDEKDEWINEIKKERKKDRIKLSIVVIVSLMISALAILLSPKANHDLSSIDEAQIIELKKQNDEELRILRLDDIANSIGMPITLHREYTDITDYENLVLNDNYIYELETNKKVFFKGSTVVPAAITADRKYFSIKQKQYYIIIGEQK